MDESIVPEVVAAYPGVDFTVPPTVIKPVHSGKGAPPPRMRIGEALVAAGLITAAQLDECLSDQRRGGPAGKRDRRLGAIVVDKGFATESDIAAGLSAITGFEHVDPVEMSPSPGVVRLVPRALAAALRLVPVDAGPTWVRVAVADPFDRRGIEAVRDATGRTSVTVAVATPASVMLTIEAGWSPEHDGLDPFLPGEPSAASAAGAGAAPAAGPSTDMRARPETGPFWEYALIGDDLPSNHRGFTPDVLGLESRLAELGAAGWDAVGVTSNGGRSRVLLKRPVYRA
ncbi:MAG TPA: hypothetical protein VNA14_03540 [Mycobacteriales bacterium]|nr:hypothetical protein [Mycobacteriales bacterium]